MIEETMYNNPKRLEEMYGKPYAEILETAKKNLIKAGCPENQIDFVINYGGYVWRMKMTLIVSRSFPNTP